MVTERLSRCLDQPRLRPFLPMLYVAWADGDLSPAEIDATRARLDAMSSLDDDCRSVLALWLRPDDPPSTAEMSSLLETLRDASKALEAPQRMTLVEFGVELARSSHPDDLPGEEERRSIEELVAVLGLSGTEASRHLLAGIRPHAESDTPEAASFPVGNLTAVLEAPYADHRERVKELLCRPGFAWRPAESSAEHRERVLTRCRELADDGLGALSFPAAYGGAGDPGRFVATFETLAFGDLSVLIKFGVQFGLFGGAVALLGSERHHRRYLRQIGTLELPGCFAMTESGHGSNVRDIATTAVYDRQRDELVVTTPDDAARKDYIGNAALHGQLAVVFAQLEVSGERHGVHAVLVPIRDSQGRPADGVRIEDCGEKLGLNGVDNGRLWFDRVRVPRQNLLNRFADITDNGTYESLIPSAGKRFFTTIGTLVGGRVSVALAALSVSKSALALAIDHGVRRRQFGPAGEPESPILAYPTHQLRLLPKLASTYALHFALRDLTERYVASQSEPDREVEARAAGLKAWATASATRTVQECREACGGHGYLAVNRFAALKADSDVFTTFEGDNTVLLQLVAKSLLTGFRRQFQDLNLLGLVRYLASEAATALTELNPVSTRRTDEDHLRDPEFHRAAFAWREQHLLLTVSRRIRHRLQDGMDAYDAFIECQDHLVETARAHVERLVLESFQLAIKAAGDSQLDGVLNRLAALFALERLESDRGWFQEHGYLEAAKSKAVRAQVRRLCADLLPDAPALVEAFDIPTALLTPPPVSAD